MVHSVVTYEEAKLQLVRSRAPIHFLLLTSLPTRYYMESRLRHEVTNALYIHELKHYPSVRISH